MKKRRRKSAKLSLEVRAEKAFQAAVRKMMVERAREGRSIFIWKKGKVVEVTADELRAFLASSA